MCGDGAVRLAVGEARWCSWPWRCMMLGSCKAEPAEEGWRWWCCAAGCEGGGTAGAKQAGARCGLAAELAARPSGVWRLEMLCRRCAAAEAGPCVTSFEGCEDCWEGDVVFQGRFVAILAVGIRISVYRFDPSIERVQ
ncbi:hypothetical protein Taro_021712 [Colocasia esculenta]|uniref:Uncharacterized protein n=1 Tax=Colocasia esculenta TaxID=4460 RepID=A0A843UZT0_COLES|nr:hypothetical protein [Colocasia esculenta]